MRLTWLRAARLSFVISLASAPGGILRPTDLAPRGGIVLSEIQYNPPSSLGSDDLHEFVEIHNRSPQPVDVSGWRLKDQDDAHGFRLPDGTSIPPGGYLVLARDAGALRSVYGDALPVVGGVDFPLANGGDTVRLLNARGELADRVEYDDDPPWPVEADGGGATLERVSLEDDITDFTNFLPGPIGDRPGTPGAPNSRAGRIPQRHDVVVNEIMYHPVKDPDAVDLQHCVADEFLEIFNRGPAAIDISGWRFTDGIDFVMPPGTSLPAGGYLVLHADGAAFRAAYGDLPNAIGPFTKELDDGGESLLLVDAAGQPVDRVDYDDAPPWSVNPDGLRGSLELVDPTSDNDRAQAWRESEGFKGTPGRKNSVTTRFEAAGGGAPPQVSEVRARPVLDRERDGILSTDLVQVSAHVHDRSGVAAVRLEYQVVRPGSYVLRTDPRFETDWTTVAMSLDAECGAHVGLLPALPHRTLVRYRIVAADAAAPSAETRAPFRQDPEPNFGYYVYDGVPDYVASRRSGFGAVGYRHTNLEKVPVYQIIMDRSDFEEVMYVERRAGDNTFPWAVTFVHENRVYDHCGVRLRGDDDSRYGAPKRDWKVRFNKGNYFRGRRNDGTPYPNRRRRMNLMPGIAGGLVEKLSLQLHHDGGEIAVASTFAHVRMVTSQDEHEQFDGDFFGLFAEVQPIDVVLIRDAGRSTAEKSSVYKMRGYPNKKHSDCDLSTSDYDQFAKDSAAHVDREWFEGNLNVDQYLSFRVSIELTNDHDMDGNKNRGFYFDSEAGLWEILPWDVECSFRENPCSGEEPLALKVPRLFDVEYKNRYRFVWQVLFNEERLFGMIDEWTPLIHELAEADVDRWAREPRLACPSCGDGPYSAAPFRESSSWIKDYIRGRVRSAIREFKDPAVPWTPRNASPDAGVSPVPPVRLRTSPFADPEGDAHAATHWLLIESGGDWAHPLWESMTTTDLEEALVPAEVTLAGREYLFRAAHIDSTGRRSLLSQPAAIRVGFPDPTPPEIPAGLSVEHAGVRSVSLRWLPSLDAETGVAGYRVLRDGALLRGPLVPGTSHVDFAPRPGSLHRYRVLAVNGAGRESAPSVEVEASVPAGGLGGWEPPPGGWDYLFDARPGEALYSDALTEARPVYLDGSWTRSIRNDWDGGTPGDGKGSPGGVAVESVAGEAEDGGTASVLSIEDSGKPREESPVNRRFIFLHDTLGANLLDEGITVIARLRVHPSPVDLLGPKSQIPEGARGQIGVAQRAGTRGHFSFWLEDGRLVAETGQSAPVDAMTFRSVWLVIAKEGEQHRVRFFLDGGEEPAIDAVVQLPAGGTESGFDRTYLEIGLSNEEDSGAMQFDYVGYKSGVHVPLAAGTPESAFVRGDATGDGLVQHEDPVAILRHLFLGEGEIGCQDSGDANDSGRLDVSDAIYLFRYLYLSGSPPAGPFPECGADRTTDSLEPCARNGCGR